MLPPPRTPYARGLSLALTLAGRVGACRGRAVMLRSAEGCELTVSALVVLALQHPHPCPILTRRRSRPRRHTAAGGRACSTADAQSRSREKPLESWQQGLRVRELGWKRQQGAERRQLALERPPSGRLLPRRPAGC